MGSNLDSEAGSRLDMLRRAGEFLEGLAGDDAGAGGDEAGGAGAGSGADGMDAEPTVELRKSSIWESEPMGPALHPFLNAVAEVRMRLEDAARAVERLGELKAFERRCGREAVPPRWGPRVLDLDIIDIERLTVRSPILDVPHPEAHRRLFVLLPLREIRPEWVHPELGRTVDDLIGAAPSLGIRRTDLTW